MSVDRLVSRRALLLGAGALLALGPTSAEAQVPAPVPPTGPIARPERSTPTPTAVPANCLNPNRAISTRAGIAMFTDALHSTQQWYDRSSHITHTGYSFGYRWALADNGAFYRSEVRNGGYQPFGRVNHFDLNVSSGVQINRESQVLVAGNRIAFPDTGFTSQAVLGLIYENCPESAQRVALPFTESFVLETERLDQRRFALNVATPDIFSELSLLDPTSSSPVTRLVGTSMYRVKAITQSGNRGSIYGIGLRFNNDFSSNAGLQRYDLDLSTNKITGASLTHLDWTINDLAVKFSQSQPGVVETVHGLDTPNGRVFVNQAQSGSEFSYNYSEPMQAALSRIYQRPVYVWMDSIAATEDQVWLGGVMMVDESQGRRAQDTDPLTSRPLTPFDQYRRLRVKDGGSVDKRRSQGGSINLLFQILLASYPRDMIPNPESFNFVLIATDPSYKTVTGVSHQGLRFIDNLGFSGMEAVIEGKGIALAETTRDGAQNSRITAAYYPNRGIAAPSVYLPLTNQSFSTRQNSATPRR